jgi:microcystin-dependent protein
MASTYSPSLKITLMGDGDQAGLWGQTTNTNLGTLVEQAITGVQNITMVDANYTLTNFNGITNEARNAVLVVTGTNAAVRDLIPPVVEKLYTIVNNTTGGFAIRVIGVSGTGVNIPNGATCLVYCDGTNFVNGLSGAAGNFTVSGALSVTSTTNLSAALSYGGVTLANAVTGTGSMVLSASPAFTGVPTAITASPGTNTTQIATTAFVLANGVPTGGLVMWPTGAAPSGFLLCTGAAVSRTTYAALFAIVGTTFGVGDGLTTFNLPNYTNRMPYGTTVGATGGSADAVVVSHTHTATSTDSGHSHNITASISNSSTPTGPAGASAPVQATSTASATANITTTINATGVSGTNANLPPYLGINFIIKI